VVHGSTRLSSPIPYGIDTHAGHLEPIILARRTIRQDVLSVTVAGPDILADVIRNTLAERSGTTHMSGCLPHDLSVMTTHTRASACLFIIVVLLLVSPCGQDLSNGIVTESDVFTNTRLSTVGHVVGGSHGISPGLSGISQLGVPREKRNDPAPSEVVLTQPSSAVIGGPAVALKGTTTAGAGAGASASTRCLRGGGSSIGSRGGIGGTSRVGGTRSLGGSSCTSGDGAGRTNGDGTGGSTGAGAGAAAGAGGAAGAAASTVAAASAV